MLPRLRPGMRGTMPGPYPSSGAANSILIEAENRELSVDPMKLQKLLYLAHGYYLAASQMPWIDELFQVWDYGPVAPSIYHEFKSLGSSNIPRGCRANTLVHDGYGFRTEVAAPVTDCDDLGQAVVNFILNTYGDKTGVYLSNLTHKIDSPWDTMRKLNNGIRNVDIPNGVIQNYFATLLSQ